MNWLADRITGHPRLIIILFVAVTATAAYKLPALRTSFSIRSFYDYKGNRDVPILDRYLAEFGDDGGFVGILIESDKIFSAPVLRYVQALSRALEREPIFRRVHSLAVTHVPRGDGDQVITGPLFDAVPEQTADLAKIQRWARDSHLVVPRLLSRDGHYTVVAAELRTPSCNAKIAELQASVEVAKSVLKRVPAPEKVNVQIGGAPSVEVETKRSLELDQRLFGGIALLLIVVTLLFVFGSAHGILLPISAVLISIVWLVGTMAWLGIEFDMLTSTTPTVLLVYGLVDSIFLMTRYYESIQQGLDRREAARKVVIALGGPCLMTSLTTALGFACFAIGSTPMMQRFGLLVALGVVFAYLTSVAWLPAILTIVPPPRRRFRDRLALRSATAFLQRIVSLVLKRDRAIILAGLLLLAGGAAAMNKLIISGSYFGILPRAAEGVRASEILSDQLGGVNRTAVLVDAGPGQFQEPRLLEAIDRVSRWAERQPIVRSVLSLSDIVKAMNQAFHGGDPKHRVVPRSKALLAQYLSLLDPRTRADFVSDDLARTHIRVLSHDSGSHLWREFARELRLVATRELGGYKFEITGSTAASYPAIRQTVVSAIYSYFIAFAVILLSMGIALRSTRAVLISIVPNLIPAVIVLGVLGLSGTFVWIGEATVLGITVGIVFDNSIHIFAAVRTSRSSGASLDEAVVASISSMGPPMVITSLLISLGFGIFMLSGFQPLRVLGLGCVIAILAGLACDLLLTHALIKRFGARAFPAPGKGGGTASV